METPTLSITPQKEKEFILLSDNKQYKIKIKIISDIILEINEVEKISGAYYSNNFSLDNLIKLGKGFRVCDTIEEAYDIIASNIETKKSSLTIIKDNEISLNLKLDLPGGKVEETKLNLYKKEINKNILIEELIKKINQLEEKNRNLENEINKIKEKNRNLENEINILKEKQNEFEKLFSHEINIKKNYKIIIEKIKFDSRIIDNIDDIKLIVNEIMNKYPILKENLNLFKSTLLYRATRDGDNHDSFYSKVENKRKTLSIIKTKKGVRFGCFLDIEIKRSNGSCKDDKFFVFSLDKKKIYNIIPGKECINNGHSEVLNLYHQPFIITNQFLSNNNSYTETSSRLLEILLGFEKDYELNNYEKNFTVEEMETFQINI